MKRILTWILTLCMLLSLVPPAVLAAEPAQAQPSAASNAVTVRMNVQMDGKYLLDPMQDVAISPELSEQYGYKDVSTTAPTLLDALIYAHAAYYGAAFNAETAKNYLALNSSSEPVKMFGVGSGPYPGDFAVEGILPNQIYPCGGGGDYYHLDEYYLNEKDTIDFFVFRDAETRSDRYTWTYKNGKDGDMTAEPGKAFTVQIKGSKFWGVANTCQTAEQFEEKGAPLSGVSVALYDPSSKTVTPNSAWTTDENGNVSISFEKAGTYYITPCGTDTAGNPVMLNLTKVVVKPLVSDPTPKSMQVVFDTADMVEITGKYTGSTYWYYFCAPDKANEITFRALDQDGNETIAEWESDSSKSLVFADPFTPKGDAVVTGNYSSRVTVTATSRLDSAVTAKATFYVVPALSLNKTTLELTTDRDGRDPNYPQSISAYPSEYADTFRLNWEVADSSVIRLSGKEDGTSRNVFPKRPGVTTVTVTDKMHPASTASVTVKVTGVSVEDAAGNFGETVTYVDKTVQLKAFSSKEDSAIQWFSMDESIATVDENGLVTGKKPGVVVIHAEDEDESIGGITVKVGKDESSIYLDGLLLESASSYYEDADYKKPLSSASYKYPGEIYGTYGHYFSGYEVVDNTYYIKESTSAFKAKLKTYFDAATVAVTYTLNGTQLGVGAHLGEYEITLPVGESTLVVRAASVEDPENYTQYVFHFVKARSTKGGVSAAELMPSNRNADTSRTFNGFAEGTCFQLDADGALIIPSSTYSNPWSSTKYSYKAFLYGDVERFRATLQHEDSYTGHIGYVNAAGKLVESQGSVTTELLDFGQTGTVSLTIKSLDDLSYSADQAAGKDPWENENVKIYTVTVVRLDKSVTGDVEISEVTFDDACIRTTPYFSPTRDKCGAMIPTDHDETTITLKVPEGIALEGKWSAWSVDAVLTEQENGIWTIVCKTPLASYGADKELKLELSKQTELGTVKNTYAITLYKLGKKLSDGTPVRQYGMPDSVVDYLPIGSQSVNDQWHSDYDQIGINPERTLAGTGGWALQITTGSFGGYVTYYFEDGITNDPGHPYGIDFTVYGNVRGRTGGPGTVLVSENGTDWYELAGSEHYDANTLWNYEVTYHRTESGTVSFTDNQGRSETLVRAGNDFQYPNAEYYPLHKWTDAEKDSLTFRGTLLLGANGLDFSQQDATAMSAAWGYTNLASPGSLELDNDANYIVKAVNPYALPGMNNGSNEFDLAWAVDTDGKPVYLDKVHYVKVQGGTLIQPTTTKDERSALLSTVAKMPVSADAGITTAPASIVVGGSVIRPESGKYSYAVSAHPGFTVSVDAAEDANVFINNYRGTERTYNTTNEAFDYDKGILRVVVQEGEKAPVIYYITVTEHSLEQIAQKDATCTEDGNIAYWYCAGCGRYFADENAGRELSEAELVIPAKGHSFENGSCTVCGAKDPDYVEPELPWVNPFRDVTESDWFYDDVRFANQNGLFNGVEKDLFAPEESMTRGMLVTVLWRLDGETAPKTATTFTDVDANAYYADAVAWAAESGVVNGIGGNKFDPEGNVTREQIAAILFRYAAFKGVDTAARASLATFPDAEKTSAYAHDALSWAVAAALVNGTKEGSTIYLDPQGSATRAQVAAILSRYAQNIVK